jgi:hypothetical protein
VDPRYRTGSSSISFLADSGANLVGLPLDKLHLLGIPVSKLSNSVAPPRAPVTASGTRTGLKTIGTFRATLATNTGSKHEADIYVIQGLRQPLLSREACYGLGILQDGAHAPRGPE